MTGHHNHGQSHSHHHGQGEGHHHGAPVDAPADTVAECPVMPGSTSLKAEAEAAGRKREHDGKTYWLCCDTCATKWDADPARFATA
ncbi:hypothetical protein [Georgenia daeguensis]|uniref:YHS domain-containing protein n=1 Tax=Georgenia daeguensis TaxID=908355 RepID=A0ABP6UPU7_9MICO